MATQKVYSTKEAEERFNTLPPEVQKFIYSPEMFAALKNIADKHKLHVDQLALLQAEVSSVMLGFTESQDFVSTLEENVRLEEAEAKLVATEVNDQVLLKIREVMKQLPKNQPNAPTPPPAPVAPAPVAPPAPQKPAEPHPAELMLSQKTVTTAPTVPAAPAKPEPYKADPYREVPE